jgi:hypothetical protein
LGLRPFAMTPDPTIVVYVPQSFSRIQQSVMMLRIITSIRHPNPSDP